MIEINLLPGAGKKARGAGAGAAVGASFASAASKIKNPFTLLATASVVLSAGAIGMLTLQQQTKADTLATTEQKQVQDSTRYASVMRQLNIIKTIDNNRFVWPHIMDEVSRALPQYTWLVSIKETTPPPAPPAAADAKDKDKKKPDLDEAPQVMKFQIIGNTVDIQALTRFMKLLEASPFIQNVQLDNSALVQAEGKEVTEFTLDAEYQRPDSTAIRTVPLTLQVR